LWFVGIVVGVIFGTASAAVGGTDGDDAGKSLVVAVEVGPGAGVDAGQVRSAIGRELARPIVPFVQLLDGPLGADEPDLLLVGLSRERIVMSMRRRREAVVARSLAASGDAAARLRAVAWLAGNVARDQVSPFLRASADLAGSGLALDAAAPKPEAPLPDPAPRVVPATEPPPVEPPPSTSVETLTASAVSPMARREAPWSVTAAGGLAIFTRGSEVENLDDLPMTFQAELVRHRPAGWLWGAGLDLGPFSRGQLGVAALGGYEHRFGQVRLEATAGLGVENATERFETTIVDSSTASSTSIVANRGGIVPYGRAFATLSLPLSRAWDLLLRAGVNAPFYGPSDGPLVMSALGVRFNVR
jgi:hypothetical protein